MRRPPLLLLLLAALSLVACRDTGAYSGTLVVDGWHVYERGKTLEGTLVIVDGRVILEEGARLNGPAYVLSGLLIAEGEIAGDVSLIGGDLRLGPGSRVGGDVRVGGGRLDLSPQAAVRGRVLTGAASGVAPADFFPRRSLRSELPLFLVEALALAGLAFLAVRFAPRPVERVRRAAVEHPVVSAAMGLLAGLVGLVLLVVMAFTLILIPVTLIGLVGGFLTIGYGWIGAGVATGRWLAGWRRWQLPPDRSAFLGTFVFLLAVNALSLLPILGAVIGLTAVAISLGAVLLTRFGLREFVPGSDELRARPAIDL